MPTQTRPAPRSDQPQTPPEPTGELLLSVPRGELEQLRVSLDSYEGHQFLSLRVWSKGQGDGWWPTRKGVTVRTRELGQVLGAMGEAARLLGMGPAPRAEGKSVNPGRPGLPGPGGKEQASGDEFDEF
jgi:hypothetical protein